MIERAHPQGLEAPQRELSTPAWSSKGLVKVTLRLQAPFPAEIFSAAGHSGLWPYIGGQAEAWVIEQYGVTKLGLPDPPGSSPSAAQKPGRSAC